MIQKAVILILFFTAVICQQGFAQQIEAAVDETEFKRTVEGYESIEDMQSFEQKGSTVNFVCASDNDRQIFVQLDFLKDNMLRIRASVHKITDRRDYVVIKDNWDLVNVTVNDAGNQVVMETAAIKITASKKAFRLSIYDKQDNPILEQSDGFRFDRSYSSTFMKLPADEHFFGFGAAQGIGGRTGFEGAHFNRLDKRGQKIDIVGRRVPFFMSTKGYGILLTSMELYNSTFRLGTERHNIYSFETKDLQLEYYFIYGPKFKDILGTYTELTGRTPLVPKWAFGGRQAGYWDQKKIEDCAVQYRQKDIPCDLLHADSTWLNKGSKYDLEKGMKAWAKDSRGYVDFKWDNRQFPDPNAMIEKLSKMNYKFSVWETALVNPNVGEFYETAAKNDYFVKDKDGSICIVSYGKRGMCAVPDFSNPAAEQWWKAQHKPLVDLGVSSFKLDHTGDLGTAKKAIFHNGRNLAQMRILHRLLNLKVAFDAVKDYTKQRGVIWSSIATAGTQRYPITWCGDYRLTFEGLQEVIKSMQNMGLSGFGYYAPDIAAKRNITNGHLYTRWAQFGIMNPMYQSWTVVPWQFGKPTEDSYRYYAKLHYRLLPFIYSYAWAANQTGVPIARAMVLEYQDDQQVYDKDLQYFLGSEFLIAPICTKSNTREIYLPKGSWTDYSTGKKYTGPQNITYEAPPDKLPIFVKAGAIIPMAPAMNFVGEKPLDPVTLDIYPAGTSSFTLYEDDDTSYDYEKGIYSLISLACSQTDDGIEVNIGPSKGEYKDNLDRTYILKVNGVRNPNKVVVGRRAVKRCKSRKRFENKMTGFWYDSAEKTVWVKIGLVKAKQGQNIHLRGAKSIE